ncbi:hypothetical protein ACVWXO_005630 [Bradyrhizobium sp. LM2.7]
MAKTTTDDRLELKPVNFGAAAIDIGSKVHMAAVNPACTDIPVQTFGTFTQDLHDLANWFKACGVTSVAMESTGVYWIPVYEIRIKVLIAIAAACLPICREWNGSSSLRARSVRAVAAP